MFVVNQRVVLPKSHKEKEGVITVVPKEIVQQSGLQQRLGRVKVMYQDGHGGMTEGWFDIDKLSAWKSPKDITAELEAKHQKEMEAVSAEKDREKLDWIEPEEKEETPSELFQKELNKLKLDKVIEVTKETDIKEEMKKSESSQTIPKRNDDNSDNYIG